MIRKQLFITFVLSLALLCSCGSSGSKSESMSDSASNSASISGPKSNVKLRYTPWVDLSRHFNLGKVRPADNGLYRFNSLDISYNKALFAGERLDDSEYNATVLGTKVFLRSQPVISNHTSRGFLNTGDKLTVMNHIGFMNGKYWDFVYVNTGNSRGMEGYVCSDFVVSQEQAEVILGYLFRQGSNLDISTPSKILRAAADVLLKFEVNKRHQNIMVQLLDSVVYDNHTIVTYRFRDLDVSNNNSMLAVVQFFNSNNDFVVLGIVPGNNVYNIVRNTNGSYDVYFN